MLIAYSSYSLIGPNTHQVAVQKKFQNTNYSLPFGFASGMLGSAYNMNGTPVVLYATMRDWSPKSFMGNVQSHFIVSSTFIIISHFLSGFWTKDVGIYYLSSIPAILLAIWLGNYLYSKIDTEKFKTYVFYLIFLLGALTLIDLF